LQKMAQLHRPPPNEIYIPEQKIIQLVFYD